MLLLRGAPVGLHSKQGIETQSSPSLLPSAGFSEFCSLDRAIDIAVRTELELPS